MGIKLEYRELDFSFTKMFPFPTQHFTLKSVNYNYSSYPVQGDHVDA